MMRKAVTQKNNLGATMVEAALVMGVFVTVVIGVIEIGRYYSAKAAMSRAVKHALEIAIRNETLLTDTRDAEDSEITKVSDMVASIADRALALSLPKNSIYSAETNIDNGSSAISKQILILRPGDSGTMHGTTVRHPTYEERQSSDNFITVMRDHPIYVEMQGSIKSFLPFLGELPIRVQAMGTAEIVARGIEGLPAGQAFTPAPCGDNLYEPALERCDVVDGVSLGDFDANRYYCDDSCQVRKYCNNGVWDLDAIGEVCDPSAPESLVNQPANTSHCSANDCVWRPIVNDDDDDNGQSNDDDDDGPPPCTGSCPGGGLFLVEGQCRCIRDDTGAGT